MNKLIKNGIRPTEASFRPCPESENVKVIC